MASPEQLKPVFKQIRESQAVQIGVVASLAGIVFFAAGKDQNIENSINNLQSAPAVKDGNFRNINLNRSARRLESQFKKYSCRSDRNYTTGSVPVYYNDERGTPRELSLTYTPGFGQITGERRDLPENVNPKTEDFYGFFDDERYDLSANSQTSEPIINSGHKNYIALQLPSTIDYPPAPVCK